MTAAIWSARAVLAIVFAAAALAKVTDRPGTVRATRGLGIAARAAGTVATVLPILEAASAALILLPVTSRIGAAMALVQLAAFTTAIAVSLRAGRRPPCHCFGSRSARPIGPDSLVRNAALMLLGVVVLTGTT